MAIADAPSVSRIIGWARELVGSRFVQFMVLGAGLFALDRAPLGAPAIRVEATPASSSAAIEDELLYQEALRLGLDERDPIVRQRLIQKALFLAEDLAGASRAPTREKLREYFGAHRDAYRQPEQYRLVHVFTRDAAAAAQLGTELQAWERAHPESSEVPALGEPFLLSRRFAGSRERLAQTLGSELAASVASAEVGTWRGPLPSKYGFHWVKLLEREPGRQAELEEVLARVELDYSTHAKKRAVASYLKAAFDRYRVELSGRPVTEFEPSGRLAPRSSPSREDG
jgi:hypothetical protein